MADYRDLDRSAAQQILDHALCGFALHEIVTDGRGEAVDYVFLEVNPAFERLTGLRANEIMGHRATEVLPGLEDEPFIEIYGQVARDGEAVQFRQRSAVLDRTYEISAYRTLPGQFVTMFVDVTAQVRAQQALRESEERFRQVLHCAEAGYFYIDRQGCFQDVNPAWLRMHGYDSRDEVIGRHFSVTQPPGFLPAAEYNVDLLLHDVPIPSGEFPRLRRDGSIGYHTFTAHPVRRAQEVVGLEGFLIDITERKRAEDQVRASLREKEMLLREIHHRVKNNLQVVVSLLELQADSLQALGMVEACRESCNRVRSMARIHEQLYLSGSLAEVDMAPYLVSLWRHLRDSYGMFHVRFDLDAGGVLLHPDVATPVGLLVNELLTNALKHAFPASLDRLPVLSVSLCRGEQGTRLKVSDNGVGLPPSLDPLEVDSLGLTLVRLLASQLSGRLEIASSPQGVCVHLWLPHQSDEESA